MGRGRAPCCDKSKVKKGPWSPEEDLRLISFIHKHGHDNWRALPNQAGLLRCGKSCRLRWINYLRPDVKRGNFTPEEEDTIIKLHNSMGNKWSKIASHFPGRTDNEIKNAWNTHFKKRLIKKDVGSHENETKSSSTSYSTKSSSSLNSIMLPGDKNIEDGFENQDNQESAMTRGKEYCLTVTPRKCNPIDEIKEQSGCSNSPSSSYASNFSSLSQVEIPRPKEEISSMHNFTDEVCNAISEGTNQEAADQVFEIPLESEIEAFWNMSDILDHSKSSESQPQEYEVCHSLDSGEEFDPEVECRKWLKNLEYELGLLGESDGDNQQRDADQQLFTETAYDNMILQPEIDAGIDCFPVWPSSPRSFGI